MTDSTLIEILLGVLAVMVGVGSFLGASRAARVTAIGAQQDVEALAYERARKIYESAISSLDEQVKRLRHEIGNLDGEVRQLRESNREMSAQVNELSAANARLQRDRG